MKYIALFYSHFGAIHFKKICDKQGYEAKLMPVPRNLSSSCGTCVSFSISDLDEKLFLETIFTEENSLDGDIEQIVCVLQDDYKVLYRAADS